MNRFERDDERFDELDEDDGDSDEVTDAMEASDEGRPWIPPIDPPVIPGGRGGVRMGAGFATSSTDESDSTDIVDTVQPPRSDDEITARVKRLLRMDAATSSLRLKVETIDGVVYLRGEVDTIDDGDLAAEVASRVRGVEDVVDETLLRD